MASFFLSSTWINWFYKWLFFFVQDLKKGYCIYFFLKILKINLILFEVGNVWQPKACQKAHLNHHQPILCSTLKILQNSYVHVYIDIEGFTLWSGWLLNCLRVIFALVAVDVKSLIIGRYMYILYFSFIWDSLFLLNCYEFQSIKYIYKW